MTTSVYTKEEAQDDIIQNALKELSEISDFTRFQIRTFCVIAQYGHQLDAKKEELFSGNEWSDPASKDILMQRVTLFLDKHIKY